MDWFISFLVWVSIFLAYFIVEFIISVFFTFKIKFVTEDNYTKAAFAGSMSTFLFMFSTLLAATAASATGIVDDYFFGSIILMLFWTTIALTIGNFSATILIPKIQKIMNKRKEKN